MTDTTQQPLSNTLTLTIPHDLGGLRLDVALQRMLPDHSRSRLQAWIKSGLVTVDMQPSTSKTKVWGGEQVIVQVQAKPENYTFTAEDIPLDIVFEDEHILVVNKPAGMVVHPAAGNWSGTLLNALLFHAPELTDVPRAGIVHRLDKDTSGLLVVAKTLAAQTNLVRQLQARTVKREYRAIVWGQLWRNGVVDQPIGRDPRSRTKMAINRMGKPAITRYEILERFSVQTYLRCNLETGRTHQIRVHMQFLKAPIVGDPIYGFRGIIPIRVMTQTLRDEVSRFNRQALHAIKLGLMHPATNEFVEWQIELADDMKALLEAMRHEDPRKDDEEEFEFSMEPYLSDEDYEDDEDFSEDDDDDLELEDEE
ncbi:23S rRNA pseudouridine(1911/1915/1917) synthase RluD [Methylotenera sp.]|uniref:23S rRNA pseudouridine(1911/1915/1917) synthase RluD n=1 Tax=Methylotenera sp. TaxID=2051956 RepID=UPI00273041A3|nr:23S rRNA pseudouridine(1911/1915/1917) synthase RluD [Methylotenera sp.]MDP2229865.1 23S rRNA pseudouridine(1911/1915/1917) synthase RluD [Methylotenera sp.]MDP3141693.1 23S rRNA pseudouridine(1911/1915/1917) synthase RluD [Methylotenera sp.]